MKITVTTRINLDKLDIGKLNQIGLYNSTERITKQAQANAPYDTGTLKKSIGTDPKAINSNTNKVRVGPRGVIYAVRREFENKKNPHRKYYMQRTYQLAQKIVQEEFEKALRILTSKI